MMTSLQSLASAPRAASSISTASSLSSISPLSGFVVPVGDRFTRLQSQLDRLHQIREHIRPTQIQLAKMKALQAQVVQMVTDRSILTKQLDDSKGVVQEARLHVELVKNSPLGPTHPANKATLEIWGRFIKEEKKLQSQIEKCEQDTMDVQRQLLELKAQEDMFHSIESTLTRVLPVYDRMVTARSKPSQTDDHKETIQWLVHPNCAIPSPQFMSMLTAATPLQMLTSSLTIATPCVVDFDSKSISGHSNGSGHGRRPSVDGFTLSSSSMAAVKPLSSLTLSHTGMTIVCMAQQKTQRIDWPAFIKVIARVPGELLPTTDNFSSMITFLPVNTGEKILLVVFDNETSLESPVDYIERLTNSQCHHWYPLDRSVAFDNKQNDRTIEMLSQSLAEWHIRKMLNKS